MEDDKEDVHERGRFAQRPEARWALWTGVAGGLLTAALSVRGILSASSAIEGMGFVFLPLIAAVAAAGAGIWGAALGHVVLRLRGEVHEPPIVFWTALAATAALPLAVAYELSRRAA